MEANNIEKLNVLMADLLRYVDDMRDCQKTYFRTRNRDDLISAKETEKLVDKTLIEIKEL